MLTVRDRILASAPLLQDLLSCFVKAAITVKGCSMWKHSCALCLKFAAQGLIVLGVLLALSVWQSSTSHGLHGDTRRIHERYWFSAHIPKPFTLADAWTPLLSQVRSCSSNLRNEACLIEDRAGVRFQNSAELSTTKGSSYHLHAGRWLAGLDWRSDEMPINCFTALHNIS